jgi:hypothetical protein
VEIYGLRPLQKCVELNVVDIVYAGWYVAAVVIGPFWVFIVIASMSVWKLSCILYDTWRFTALAAPEWIVFSCSNGRCN